MSEIIVNQCRSLVHRHMSPLIAFYSPVLHAIVSDPNTWLYYPLVGAVVLQGIVIQMVIVTISANVTPLVPLVGECMCRVLVASISKRITTHSERVAHTVMVAMHRIFDVL